MKAILASHHRSLVGGVMHCFAGDPSFAEQCLAWGLHISFAGNVTFPKAQELRDAALFVPMDRLLVETDSPYLAPIPLRGKRCEPSFVKHTAQLLAELKEVPVEEFARQTTENARRVFHLPLDPPTSR
jgi:TatD DNase family protein